MSSAVIGQALPFAYKYHVNGRAKPGDTILNATDSVGLRDGRRLMSSASMVADQAGHC
jgi:hypothetical protein